MCQNVISYLESSLNIYTFTVNENKLVQNIRSFLFLPFQHEKG